MLILNRVFILFLSLTPLTINGEMHGFNNRFIYNGSNCFLSHINL